MNLSTEDLKKLLEDCWAECEGLFLTSIKFKGFWDKARDTYITSQLSALQGKGEGGYFPTTNETFKEYLGRAIGSEKQVQPTTTLPPANQPTGMWEKIIAFTKFIGKNNYYVDEEGIWIDAFAGGKNVTDAAIKEFLDETPPTAIQTDAEDGK